MVWINRMSQPEQEMGTMTTIHHSSDVPVRSLQFIHIGCKHPVQEWMDWSLRENLQETFHFPSKHRVFLYIFPSANPLKQCSKLELYRLFILVGCPLCVPQSSVIFSNILVGANALPFMAPNRGRPVRSGRPPAAGSLTDGSVPVQGRWRETSELRVSFEAVQNDLKCCCSWNISEVCCHFMCFPGLLLHIPSYRKCLAAEKSYLVGWYRAVLYPDVCWSIPSHDHDPSNMATIQGLFERMICIWAKDM